MGLFEEPRLCYEEWEQKISCIIERKTCRLGFAGHFSDMI